MVSASFIAMGLLNRISVRDASRHHLVGGASLYLPVAGFNIKIAEGVFIQRIVTRRDSLDAKETLEKPFDSKAGRKSRLSGW